MDCSRKAIYCGETDLKYLSCLWASLIKAAPSPVKLDLSPGKMGLNAKGISATMTWRLST